MTLLIKIIQNRKVTLDNPIYLPEIYVKHVTERILSFSATFTDTQQFRKVNLNPVSIKPVLAGVNTRSRRLQLKTSCTHYSRTVKASATLRTFLREHK